MDKVKLRQEAIKKLIKENAIEDQQTLVTMITEKYGIDANQSIVSRDLLKLGITKSLVDGKLIYEEKSIDASREILRLAIIDIKFNESLIVVNTIPAIAAFVGDYLDSQQDKVEILGTLAGENIVFIAPKSTKDIKKVFNEICKILFFKKHKE
ncbi:MAG: hypothetical protein P4L22_04780 [Candidatus Babeliales bacterium]|nr:hypothetical protein [Candidatus Babeliales bacterium]